MTISTPRFNALSIESCFCEWRRIRGLEPYGQLLKLCDRENVYGRFMGDLCRRADEKYNSGLFHFQKEQSTSEAPDRISPKLTVDDKVFKPILQSLYFEHGSPYRFRVLPVEILGTIYERFLGKVIRLMAGHQAKIEEKPEVRKAGGSITLRPTLSTTSLKTRSGSSSRTRVHLNSPVARERRHCAFWTCLAEADPSCWALISESLTTA